MSFAGHAFNAIKVIKANRALLKKNTYFKNAAFDPKWDKHRSLKFKKPSADEIAKNRRRNQVYLKNQRRQSRIGLLVAALFALLIFIIVFWLL